MGLCSGQPVLYVQCALCPIQLLIFTWVIPRSLCHLLLLKGCGGERNQVGALFFSCHAGSERTAHKIYAPRSSGESAGKRPLFKESYVLFRGPFRTLLCSPMSYWHYFGHGNSKINGLISKHWSPLRLIKPGCIIEFVPSPSAS